MGKKEDQPQWDPNMEAVMKLVLGKKGIKTKYASEVGKKKVAYFRGRDFKKFLLDNAPLIKKKCQGALNEVLQAGGAAPESDKDIEKLGDELIRGGFCYKSVYKPINSRSDDKKPEKKWPDRLTKAPNQRFDCEGFYVIEYEGDKGMQHLMLALIIGGILLACMWPVWPMWAKVGIWYLLVLFLSLYFGILIWRLVFFALVWIVGFDFWLFPNINDEYCSFLDTFKPLWSFDKRADDAFMLLVRFGSLAITAVAVQQIAETTSFNDIEDLVVSSYSDLLEWGVEKLSGALPEPDKRQMLASFDEMMAELDNETNTTNGPPGDGPRGVTEEDADPTPPPAESVPTVEL